MCTTHKLRNKKGAFFFSMQNNNEGGGEREDQAYSIFGQ
jgi:hypothetical protein